MFRKQFRDTERTAILKFHAQRQRLHSAMKEKAGMRIERAAEMIEQMLGAIHDIPAADDRARNDVRMSIQVFRAAMQRKVEAMLRRTKIHWAGKGIVDHRNQAMLLRERRSLIEIRHLEKGI